ncbi:hypothetical protein IW261DRAFT_1420317 [Armillaria novae-zelandiae]|uniref:Uncharacterized protein n=1 Tax=Armillaria novae-zelandiae TaxID=153914 RepID=A0AA39P7Z1_9AGAR|nr:hypothetical protein IW261DRAFT_1420317 [Armillaria novae-zelandiae]
MYGSILRYDLEAGSKLQAMNMKLKAQTTVRSLADSVVNDECNTGVTSIPSSSSFSAKRRIVKQDGLSSPKAVNSEANDKQLQTGNNAGTSRIIVGHLPTFQYLDITVASVQEVTHEDMENTGKSQIYRQQCSTIQCKHMLLHTNGSELGGDAGQEVWYDF